MSIQLILQIAEDAPLEVALTNGRYRIGSSPECEIPIKFDEVPGIAAYLDVRGEAVFIRNANPYPIYVGEDELAASQQGEWPLGHTVLLTQNVSLELQNVEEKLELGRAEQSAQRTRSTLQIAVVVLCAVTAYYLLTSENVESHATNSSDVAFTEELVEPLLAQDASSYKTVLNYLIDARVQDVRWGQDEPQRAIAAYQLLLGEPEIRDADQDDESTEGKIRRFALARVEYLYGMQGPR